MNLQSVKQRFGIVGYSKPLDRALQTAIQVAPSDLTVLITGETGVGKESFARIIHSLSARKHNKLIVVNCGAIPEGTINSELFGHVKGSFTGATADRKGYFETVDGGTIVLDEIGEMPLDTQAFLLRVLEQGEFLKVGSSKVEKTDVRIVASTNVRLLEKVKKGKFREDLYYRLSTVPIEVPPLRERGDDIHLLFRKFAADFAERHRTDTVRLDDKAQLLLQNYRWPGNIRELKNVAERISALAQDKQIDAETLLEYIPQALDRHLPALSKEANEEAPGYYERELLFKFLYDMKKDLNDLKSLIVELVRTNDLNMPNNVPALEQRNLPAAFREEDERWEALERMGTDDVREIYEQRSEEGSEEHRSPIIINTNTSSIEDRYENAEEIEESLSLEDMERDYIARALRKHGGRRKEAAQELGISQRTLYRKIKQYDLDG